MDRSAVWDEEFRFRLFEVDGSPRQHLVIRVQRRYNRDGEVELELVGEARIVVDGSFDAFDRCVALPSFADPSAWKLTLCLTYAQSGST